MAIVLGILQFVLITIILIKEFESKSSAAFLWATLFIMFGVPHLLASINGDDTYSNEVLAKASLFAIAFCLIYWGVRFLIASKTMRQHRELMQYESVEKLLLQENVDNRIMFIILITVEVLAIYPYIKYAGNIFATSWGVSRTYSASLDYVNAHQIYRIVYYSLSGLMVSAYVKKQRWLIAVLGVLLLGIVIVTRNRIEILPLLCSILAIIIFKNKTISIKVVIIGALSAVAIIYIVYGLRVFRHYGTIQDFINGFSLSEYTRRINLYIQNDDGELGLRRVFYYFLKNNNDFEDFGKAHTYIRMLFVYIPTRWSLGLKPDDFAIAMGHAYGMSAGGSTHPTLFGDCYANLDVFGVFLGAFWALYSTIVDRIVCKTKSMLSKILIYVLNAVVFVIIGRGSVYNAFWFAAYGVPFIIVVEWFLLRTNITRIPQLLSKGKK